MVQNVLLKNLADVVLLPFQIINLQMNFIGRLLENFMQSLSKKNRGIIYLLCAIDFHISAYVVPI